MVAQTRWNVAFIVHCLAFKFVINSKITVVWTLKLLDSLQIFSDVTYKNRLIRGVAEK